MAGVVSAFSASFRAMELAKAKIAAVALANEKIEELRNMPYDNLATEHGTIYPPGAIHDDEEFIRRGVRLNAKIVISYVDDPFDGNAAGTIPGKPQDLYPSDYKKIEVTVSKVGRPIYLSRLTSNVAAKAAETPSNSGIINLCVVDSLGAPVPEANITITNLLVEPNVDIHAVTGVDGCIMVPNLPEELHNHYNLTVSKDGYSQDQTYPRTAQNIHTLFPDVNVLVQQVTSQTLIIDRLSTMRIDVKDTQGQPVPNAPLHIEGKKEIYFNPATPKYSQDFTADANGHLEITNMEFDDYSISVNGWNVISTSPYQPVGLKANTTQDIAVTVNGSGSYPVIYNSEPLSGTVGDIVNLAVNGKNFSGISTVRIVDASANEILGANIEVTGDEAIEAQFNLTGAATGFWDIIVDNPGGESVRQIKGFEVK